jgi:hypothetical protein
MAPDSVDGNPAQATSKKETGPPTAAFLYSLSFLILEIILPVVIASGSGSAHILEYEPQPGCRPAAFCKDGGCGYQLSRHRARGRAFANRKTWGHG